MHPTPPKENPNAQANVKNALHKIIKQDRSEKYFVGQCKEFYMLLKIDFFFKVRHLQMYSHMSFHTSYLKLIDLICAKTRLCHQPAERIIEHSKPL